ncbi:hypothetical protein HanRHA438_Chr16g0768481 [Helianthus annuus]|nr:hypothetical protein HanRHA438_Chr16g0768481 [Helianthus annuus]
MHPSCSHTCDTPHPSLVLTLSVFRATGSPTESLFSGETNHLQLPANPRSGTPLYTPTDLIIQLPPTLALLSLSVIWSESAPAASFLLKTIMFHEDDGEDLLIMVLSDVARRKNEATGGSRRHGSGSDSTSPGFGQQVNRSNLVKPSRLGQHPS